MLKSTWWNPLKEGIDVTFINRHETRVDDVVIKVGLTHGKWDKGLDSWWTQSRQSSNLLERQIVWPSSIDSTEHTPNSMDDRKSNQSVEYKYSIGIIMTQRQWITHPFDIDMKRVPSLKMTQWIVAWKMLCIKPSLFFCSFIFMKLERKGTMLLWSLFRISLMTPKKCSQWHDLVDLMSPRK